VPKMTDSDILQGVPVSQGDGFWTL
jgi:hypothetical protein